MSGAAGFPAGGRTGRPVAPACHAGRVGDDRRVPTGLLLLLGALSAFGPLSMDLYLPALPELAADLDATESAAQLTMTACMVGLAAGQLLWGPVSDRFGRRRPLLAGVAAWTVLALACAAAPSMAALVALRLVQGVAGGAGMAIARAVVRDRLDTDAAARAFSALILVLSVAPVVAPLLGGQLMQVTSWRGLFVALAAIGCVLLAAAVAGVPETLPPAARTTGGIRATAGQLAAVVADRRFLGFAAVVGLVGGTLFTYISMSPFVLQDGHGLSAQAFSLVFAANACGLVLAGRLNMAAVGRFGSRRMATAGLASLVLGAGGMTLVAALDGPLAALLPLLWLTVASVAVVMPNTTALALAPHGARAGAASGLLGLAQFGIGGVIGPLASLTGVTTALMAATMLAAAGCALGAHLLTSRLPVPATAGPASAPAATPPVTADDGAG